MKKRLIAGGLALLLFFWLSMMISSNFGLLLAGQMKKCSLRTFKMLAVLAADPRSIKLFLLLVAGSILLVLWMLFGNSYLNYKSDMYEVVPGFSIPRPEGQGQHGTAWFVQPMKFAAVFASVEAEETLPLPPELTERYLKERGDIHAADDKAG